MAEIRPQAGYQEKALCSSADIVIGGAAAGVGKTFTLLLEFLRHIQNPNWGGVIFRRTSPQIRNEGGLWDTSMNIYPLVGAEAKESMLEWQFPKGPRLKFSHLEHEKNVLDWQGSQIPFIGFDELTHFTEKQFFYLLSRNRSTCGVKPYVRATCNPDPESWVAKLIEWWVDSETGFPIPERDGAVRYFIKSGNDYIWGDTEEEVKGKAEHILRPLIEKSGIDASHFIKSLSFVSGSIYDNKALLNINPGYLANLLSQDEQTRMQLLDGNWKVVLSDADIYQYPAFLGMFNNVYEVNKEGRYITADIALKGSNKFIAGYWEGNELADILIMNRSDGKEVVDGIKGLARQYKVQNHNILYDNDGVGGFVDGFIPGAIPFMNGGTPFPDPNATSVEGMRKPENYANLKAQCVYRSGDSVNKGEYKVSEKVSNTMYDDKMTVRQRMIWERKAFKRDKTDADGKLCVIKKEDMKVKLGGESPDVMDMFFMKKYFDLAPRIQGSLI
jgi:hypothetical protein